MRHTSCIFVASRRGGGYVQGAILKAPRDPRLQRRPITANLTLAAGADHTLSPALHVGGGQFHPVKEGKK